MNNHCVDAAFYWTPKEAAAIVDYLDRLRDTVWELYSDDIIGCRTKELDEQCDPRQQHLCFDNKTDQIDESEELESTPFIPHGRPTPESTMMNDNNTPREALPSFEDLPSLSDENIGDMLTLLRALLHACEEHYKAPIRRLDEQRDHEHLHPWRRDRSKPPMTDWDEDTF
jgi:hypothetical protein